MLNSYKLIKCNISETSKSCQCPLNLIYLVLSSLSYSSKIKAMIMLNEVHKEFKRYSKHCHSLKRIIDDTQHFFEEIHSSLETVYDLNVILQNTIKTLKQKLERAPTFLVFGQNCHAKALFVNTLLGQNILPLNGSNWRYVTFVYGYTKNVRLILANDIEIVEGLQAHKVAWTTIPEQDMRRNENESVLNHCPSLEIELFTPLLKDNISIDVPPDCQASQLCELLTKQHSNILPIIVYCISEHVLNDVNIQEINGLKGIFKVPFLFLKINDVGNVLESYSLGDTVICSEISNGQPKRVSNLADQLMRLGFMSDNENTRTENTNSKNVCLGCSFDTLTYNEKLKEDFLIHIRNVLKHTVLKLARKLSEVHSKCLRKFILSAFDMARELQITPKRLDYAKKIELQLYETLLSIACEQQEEIAAMIQRTLVDMKSNVAEVLEGYNRNNGQRQVTPKIATIEIQHLILQRLNESVAAQLVQSVGCLHESFTGTLQRCLENLEKTCHVLEGGLSASNAVKQIVSAAYNIDLTSPSSFSITHNLMDKLKMLLTSFILPWASTNQIQCNLQWQLQVATNVIDRLNASKLAKTICLQFKEIIRTSHESFQSAMRSLDHQLSDQLEHTEEQRIMIRKRHAPHFARLALESTSLSDYIKYGMPKQIKEIGRGQYGVVSSCEPWANINPCAYKSVVPPDDRHWNDLAMEFFYTRTIAEHPRIVKFRGSVIDYSYGGGNLPAVLLIMERMSRDLYCGLRSGLAWQIRLRIAIDVIEGIRYLHSQGLVHRDIKLKNVLLDNNNRAKLTDFGFCIPEAMMSGSIVGTPVHMAPELLSGRYDSKVDVYAFGILFWYICSGQVKIPMHFDQFQNKEQLWDSVKKGMRPECLPNFDIKCWNLMEQCWAPDPADRPLLGYVQPQLEHMYNKVAQETEPYAQDTPI